MGNILAFLKSRAGTVVIWVVVMYLTAFLWSVVDRGWYAFPTYIVAVFIWIGSFVNMLGAFFEWTGSSVRLKPFEAKAVEANVGETTEESADVDED
jgi:hypothetical protein